MMQSRLAQLLERYFEEVVCGLLLCGMTFFVSLQIVMRYIFNNPFAWSDELVLYFMVWVTYFGGALAVRERAHIRLLNLVFLLPKPFSYVPVVLGDAIWVGFNVLMVWQGVLLVQNFWLQPYISAALGISQKWPYMIIPLGFILMTVRMIQVYYRWIRYGESPVNPPDEVDFV